MYERTIRLASLNACHFRFSGERLAIDYIAYVCLREWYTMYGTKYVHQCQASNGCCLHGAQLGRTGEGSRLLEEVLFNGTLIRVNIKILRSVDLAQKFEEFNSIGIIKTVKCAR